MAIQARGIETATAPSPINEQSITGFAHAEIMLDADTGQAAFCIALNQNLSDFQAGPVARGLAAAEKLREKADEIEALTNEYAATVVIPAFIEQYGIVLEELDLATLTEDAPGLAAGFRAFCAAKDDGTIIVAVPEGQPPVQRLTVIRDLVLDLQARAEAA